MVMRWIAEKELRADGVRESAGLYHRGKLFGGVIRYTGERRWVAWTDWGGEHAMDYARRCEAKRWVETRAKST